jgi:hypothetical protein
MTYTVIFFTVIFSKFSNAKWHSKPSAIIFKGFSKKSKNPKLRVENKKPETGGTSEPSVDFLKGLLR